MIPAVAAAILLGGCGEDSAEQAPAGQAGDRTQREGRASDGRAGDRAERDGDGPAREDSPGEEKPGAREAGPEECAFEAPPGRLADEHVVVELSGIPCDQGIALARAGALGQPAGANLVFERDGFWCEPSTQEKGANATYSCIGDGGEASFEVVWSGEGG